MLNRFIETCNVACSTLVMLLELALFVCLLLHHAAPHHSSVLEYLTSVPLTPFTDMCGRGGGRLFTDSCGRKICGRGRQNVRVRTSLTHITIMKQDNVQANSEYIQCRVFKTPQ